jgi:hypothetical protein
VLLFLINSTITSSTSFQINTPAHFSALTHSQILSTFFHKKISVFQLFQFEIILSKNKFSDSFCDSSILKSLAIGLGVSQSNPAKKPLKPAQTSCQLKSEL